MVGTLDVRFHIQGTPRAPSPLGIGIGEGHCSFVFGHNGTWAIGNSVFQLSALVPRPSNKGTDLW